MYHVVLPKLRSTTFRLSLAPWTGDEWAAGLRARYSRSDGARSLERPALGPLLAGGASAFSPNQQDAGWNPLTIVAGLRRRRLGARRCTLSAATEGVIGEGGTAP